MTDEQIVKQWFLRLLADFRIYSPLYKVMVELVEWGGVYRITATAGEQEIRTRVMVSDGAVKSWTAPTMHWKGEQDEMQKSDQAHSA